MPEERKDEELNIAGVESTFSDLDRMAIHHGDLSDLVKPGASNEELLDAILDAPSDKLIPWEECVLPSMGYYYGWPDGVCYVRPMGQTAEKILATQRLASSGQSIDYLFRECCKFPQGFDPSELLLGDRVFILYFLRGITHGNMYEFAVTCPNNECGAVNTHAYDLNDLVSTVKTANTAIGKEPFKIVLPYLSNVTKRDFWVSVKFLRAYDANDMIAKRRSRKKMFSPSGGIRSKSVAKQRAEEAAALRQSAVDPRQQQHQNVVLDNALDDNLDRVIVNVMGVEDRFKIRALVQKMHASDTATIREWLRDNTPGIENTVEIVCPDCSNEFKVELPITENFFRPSHK